MLLRTYLLFGAMAASIQGAATLQWDFSTAPVDWAKRGESELFSWDAENQNLQVTWNSSKTNSFYSVALPQSLSISNTFSCEFDLRLNSINIGTTPGKPYTFQIAVGFFNSVTSFRENFYIGTGTDATLGPRNLLEFNYFPDSGFGGTVAPIIVSKDNQFFYSHNFPLELATGDTYTVKMVFDATTRTVQSTLYRNGIPDGVAGDGRLRNIPLPSRFTDFAFDRFGISSYSDYAQEEQFAGSIRAEGSIDNVTLTLPEQPQPRLIITDYGTTIDILVPTRSGFSYRVEGSSDLVHWQDASQPIVGSGGDHIATFSKSDANHSFFRVRVQAQ